MHVLLGYFLCLVVVTPAFSVDVFFALIGATPRQHDLLAIVRAVSRMLLSVTSPFKIGLTLLVLFGLFLSDSDRRVRGFGLLIVGALSISEFLPLLHAPTIAGFGPAATLHAFGLLIFLTFRSGSRLLTAWSR